MGQFLYRPKFEVTVNGIRRRAYAADTSNGASSPIAQASVAFRKADGEIAGGDVVVVRQGYTFPLPITFEGEVQDDSITYWPNALSATAMGYLARAQYPLGTEGEENLIDEETGEPLPLQSWSGVTDQVVVGDLLDLCGIPRVTPLAGASVILGDIEPITLMPDQAPLDLIQQIDEALGWRTRDRSDGLVERILYSDVPAGNPALVLVQGKDMLAGSRERSAADVRNRALVTGVPNDAFTPSVKVDTASATSPTTGKPYIPTPPGYRAYTFQSSILDTEALCELHATRKLGELNRLRWSTSFDLSRGMPILQAGQSCFVTSAALDFDAGAIFYIDQVTHRSDLSSLRTSVVLKGAFAAEGVNTNQAPIPAFTVMVIREHIQGTGDIYIILADASGSTDPDGAFVIPPSVNELGQEVEGYQSNGIAAYEWSSTLGVAPRVSDEGVRATWMVTSNPDGETITLDVFDLQGRTASLTKTIRVDANHPALVRDLWAAMTSVLLFSDDGERTWQEIAIPATFVVEMSAYDYTLALDAAGAVYRVETDLTFATPATAPANGRCAFITWVYPDTKINGDRAWIGTADGRIFFSSDRALTFAHQATLEGGPAITSIQESPFSENDIWVTAANKIWHSYDGVNFEIIYDHPNDLLTAVNIASGFDSGYAAFRGDPPAVPGSEASRIRERFGNFEGDWNRDGTTFSIPAGTYKVAYTYGGSGGETLPSPEATVVVAADQAINIAPLAPLPQGAYYAVIYLSETPGSLLLRRLLTLTGYSDHPLTTLPEIDAPVLPVANTTDLALTDPTVAPVATAIAAEVGEQDFPAQPRWITMGADTPMLMAVGTSPDAPTGMAWWAMADAPFTFRRGTYDPIALGEPVHAIRDGNIPGVAYFAAGEGIGKTTSYFVDDAFLIRAATGAEEAKMIGYGNLHTLIFRGNIIWVGCTGYDSNSRPTAPIVVNALNEGGFVRLSDHPCAAHVGVANTFPLLHVGDGVLATWSQARASGTAKTSPGGGPTNAYRSTDGGITWDAMAPTYVAWLATDGAGTVYALCYGGFPNVQTGSSLQRSDDGGATWTTVFTAFPLAAAHTGIIPSHVYVNPVNPLEVGLRQNQLFRSTDGGASFAEIGSDANGYFDQSGFGGGYETAYSNDGNWVLWRRNDVGQPLRRLPAAGGVPATTVIPTGSEDFSLFSRGGSGIVAFGVGLDSEARYSTDEGATWANIFTDAQIPPGGHPDFTGRTGAHDFIIGDAANGWYWFVSNTNYGVAIGQSAPSDTPPTEYVSLQGGLVDAFPDGAYWCVPDGATRIVEDEG